MNTQKHYRRSFLINLALMMVALLIHHSVIAQWGAPYANSWIEYGKPYVKIGITKKGLHRIPFSSLPKNFSTKSPEKFQLWRRGKQVAIISTSNNEIVFYAVPNDGSSDSLLYRPMSSRLNPFFSMYSDEGSYFLTVGETSGNRAKTVNEPVDSKVPLLPFHEEVLTTVLQEQYSLSTQINVLPDFFNSYFELGASRTGHFKEAGEVVTQNFKLKNYANSAQKPTIKLLAHGRSNNEHKIEVYVGKNAGSLRLVTSLENFGFSGVEYKFELASEDTDTEKNGVLVLKTANKGVLDRYSLTYYSIAYPQLFQVENQLSKEFRLKPVTESWSRVSVSGTSGNFKFLDISDADNPIVLEGKAENLMVPRRVGKNQLLLATSEVNTVNAGKIKEVKFETFAPKEPNYIIITSDSLLDGATRFADYRASKAGGGFKPLIANIKEIYDQFNYGEPSPLAIKRFMSYMLTEGGKDKYLFLIGKSITHNERMVRELPGEVPTMGYPGSDMLLVEGIAGAPLNAPAVPVGRFSAITNQNVLDYLQKVEDYEHNLAGDYGWRKNVLHINGGKTVGEITQLKELLQDLEPMVSKGVAGGTVNPFVKQQGMAEIEVVNITPEVNKGAGLITYFGHGAPFATDLDIGYITDAARGYNNLHKYPMMYFNGCGVGNIFSARFNPKPKNPNAGDRLTLSLDWLIAPNRGSVAIIANSFESFVTPAATYLNRLYHFMFIDPKTADLPIGKIQLAVANDILSNYNDKYSIANVHQSLLQGDPALRLITVDKPDYAVDPDLGIKLFSGSSDKSFQASDSIRVQILISNNGRFISGQNVPVTVSCFGKKETLVKELVINAFGSQHILNVAFLNSKDVQKIRFQIDPKHVIGELNVNNNMADIEVDWSQIKDKTSYSFENARDNIAPRLNVSFNDRLLKKDEILGLNPIITIQLSDNRQLFPDTALIDVFIKRCGDEDCDFEKIPYSNMTLEVDSADSRTLRLTYPSMLDKGIYEVLIHAKDRAGNAVVQPYRIRFEVGEKEDIPVKLVVSPNPTPSYLRFELESARKFDIKLIRCLIYNDRGILVEDKSIPGSTLSLSKEWYWIPSQTSSGLYTYKVILINHENTVFGTLSGKVMLVR